MKSLILISLAALFCQVSSAAAPPPAPLPAAASSSSDAAGKILIPTIGVIDDFFSNQSTVAFSMDSDVQRKFTDIVATDLKLMVVLPQAGPKWSPQPVEEIDVTPGVIALVELDQGGGKNASDPAVTAGPTVADPSKEVVFAVTQNRFVRGVVTGYDGQTYQVKTLYGVVPLGKKDVLCYGVVVPAQQFGVPDKPDVDSPRGELGEDDPGRSAAKDVLVRGYFREDGAFVHSYLRAHPGFGRGRKR